jgi:hypothetical protein
MCKLADLPDGTPLLAFEEVKWEPEVMIPELDPNQVCDGLGALGVCVFWGGVQGPGSRVQGPVCGCQQGAVV